MEEEVIRLQGKEVKEEENNDDESNTKPVINVSTHIEDSYVSEDDLKIEIHKLINSIDNKDSFLAVKQELEDRFGKISEDMTIYMYEEWFEKLVCRLKLSNVHQNRNSIELVFPAEIVEKMDTEELFMDAFQVSNMFRFISRGTNLVIVLDIIKLEKHPIFYLVDLLDKIDTKFGKSID